VNETLLWLLAGLLVGVIGGWLAYRARKRADARRESQFASADSA
jgi:hypothetical protein